MTHSEPGNWCCTRRDFLKAGLAGGALMSLSGPLAWGNEAAGPEVWVFHGPDKTKLIDACMKVVAENGGLGRNVRRVALKVNAAWTRTPEEGANTHPLLVDGFLRGCKQMGIPRIVLPEHPCHRAEQTFSRSGIEEIAKRHGAAMIDLKSKQSFQHVSLSKAKNLKDAEVAAEYLEADAIVNIPVAKHHSGATLSMAMKNWMGVVKDRGFWHRNDLHQCIADFSTYIRPTWTIIDATRTMMDHGPQGPAKTLKTPNQLILSRDQVAADVVAAYLFHPDPLARVRYLSIARQMKIGETDKAKMRMHLIDLTKSA